MLQRPTNARCLVLELRDTFPDSLASHILPFAKFRIVLHVVVQGLDENTALFFGRVGEMAMMYEVGAGETHGKRFNRQRRSEQSKPETNLRLLVHTVP